MHLKFFVIVMSKKHNRIMSMTSHCTELIAFQLYYIYSHWLAIQLPTCFHIIFEGWVVSYMYTCRIHLCGQAALVSNLTSSVLQIQTVVETPLCVFYLLRNMTNDISVFVLVIQPCSSCHQHVCNQSLSILYSLVVFDNSSASQHHLAVFVSS